MPQQPNDAEQHWVAIPGKEVAVIILNFNGLKYLKQYLHKVLHRSLEAEVVVADNGSTDGSLDWIRSEPSLAAVRLLDLRYNHGFAQGYNLAIAPCPYPLTLLLNSDVEPAEGWLAPLLAAMHERPAIGACQPKILAMHNPHQFEFAGASGGLIDHLGYPFCRGRIFDECELDHGQYDKPLQVFWATGAAMLCRTDLYNKLGGLDAFFFAHMEEIDLCWRMAHAGYEVWAIPTSQVYHVGGGTLHKSNPRKTFLNFRNGLLLLYKNLPAGKVVSTILTRLVLDGLAGLNFIKKGQFADCWAIIRAHFAFYGAIGKYRSIRQQINPPAQALSYKGIWQQSIVWRHFGMGVKRYSEL